LFLIFKNRSIFVRSVNINIPILKNYIKIVLFFLLILLYTAAFSQNITQLEEQLKSSSGIEEIKIIIELSELYLDINPEKSIELCKTSLKLAKDNPISDKLKIEIYNIFGAAYYYSSNYRKSVKYYEKELSLTKKTTSNSEIAKSYYNIALLYSKSAKKNKAEKNFIKSIEYAKKANNITILTYNYKALSSLKELNGNNSKALEYLKEYLKIKNINFNKKQNVLRKKIKKEKVLRKKTELVVTKLEKDTLKKAEEIEYLNIEKEIAEKLAKQEQEINETRQKINEAKQKIQNAEIEKQKMRNYILIGIAGVILILGIIILKSYIRKRKANVLLLNKNFEIQQQKEEIETQNGLLQSQKEKIERSHTEITQSINYASRIQTAMLHGEEILNEKFNQYFIFFKPKDVVSGDFFWIKQIGKNIIIVTADCTGHGVPGAFMSMLGISLLNEISSKQSNNPGEILDTLRTKIKLHLKQTGEYNEQKDGMDMALCIINTENLKAKFAGANNPLYIIRNKEFTEYKATRNPIGIYLKEKHFETQNIQLQKDDLLYMSSDGYIDQFGGEKGGKFKSKQFKQLLIDNSEYSMEKQKSILENTLRLWQGKFDQVDDILITGIKI